jgi:predicted amidohydrolase YtcJ
MVRLLPLLLLACGDTEPAPVVPADLVVSGGRIHLTVAETTDAIAIIDGMVVSSGAAALAQVGANTVRVELDGAVVYPGFTDSHVHLLAGSFVLDRLLLLGTSSMDRILSSVENYASNAPDEPWVVGYGWMAELVEDPSGVALDAVVSDRPVLLVDNSGHAALVNTVAMERAGIDDDTPDPDGGTIVRDADGHATGLLLEEALGLVSGPALADYDDATLASGLARALDDFSASGITSISEIVASPGFDLTRPWIYADMDEAGELPLRINYFVPLFYAEGGVDNAVSGRGEAETDRVRFAGAKIWVDGSMGTGLAWTSEPMEGTDDHYGSHYFDALELTDVVEEAEEAGLALKLHVNGDAAVGAALDAFEAVAARRGGLQQPHVLDHVVLISSADVTRMAELGLPASIQPSHSIASSLGNVADAWGEDRMERSYDAASFAAAGVPLALGTDWPVWPTPDPLVQVWAAVTHLEGKGLTVEEAMEAVTAGGALAAGCENRLGKLLPGFHADFVILDQDPLDMEPESIPEVDIQAVYVGGDQVR